MSTRLVAGLAVMGLMIVGSFFAADKRSEIRADDIERSRLHVFRTICSQNNIGKADTIWRVSRAKTAFGSEEAYRRELGRERRLQIILDCVATFRRGGRAVPLSAPQSERFVQIVGMGRVPLVRGGQVVGHREAETGRIADF